MVPPVSFEATASVWAYTREHPEMPSRAVLVLLALADRYNNTTGQLNPSVKRIAADCHVSPATVKAALSELEEAGVIGRRQGGGKASTRYVLFVHNLANPDPGQNLARSNAGQDLAKSRPGAGQNLATNQERNKKEPAHDAATPDGGVGAAPVLTVVLDEDEKARRADAAMRAVMEQFSKNRRMPA